MDREAAPRRGGAAITLVAEPTRARWKVRDCVASKRRCYAAWAGHDSSVEVETEVRFGEAPVIAQWESLGVNLHAPEAARLDGAVHEVCAIDVQVIDGKSLSLDVIEQVAG